MENKALDKLEKIKGFGKREKIFSSVGGKRRLQPRLLDIVERENKGLPT